MIDIDATDAERMLEGVKSQVPYVAAKALNDVAQGFQKDHEKSMYASFQIKRQWMAKATVISGWARANNLNATVELRRDHMRLKPFETGEVRKPVSSKSLLVDQPAVRTGAGNIAKSKRPRAFGFQLRGTKGNVKVFEGQKRTVMIQQGDGRGVVLQRTGRGKRGALKVLWRLTPRAKTPHLLHFVDTALQSFKSRWNAAYSQRWNESVARRK
jgi:hypothetical protein